MVKKLWKDPIWSAVIATGIVTVATYLLGYWPQMLRVVKSVPNLLATSLSIPLWVVALAVPSLLLTLPLISTLRSVKEPRFLSYTSDTIFDINWSWRWLAPGYSNSYYTPHELLPRCPSCSSVLNINDYSESLVTCIHENCSWEWSQQGRRGSRISHSSELDSRVRNEIDRRVHAGERG